MAVSIELSKNATKYKGYFAIVSDEDKDLVEFNWCCQRDNKNASNLTYATRNDRTGDKRIVIIMHRVILERVIGRPLEKGEQVDHIDGDGLNNQRSNLRLCTQAQNTLNTRMYKNNQSGYKGVSFHAMTGRWQAYINVSGKRIYLGLYDTKEDARDTRREAAMKYHKEFFSDERGK